MVKVSKPIVERATALLEPVLEDEGYELVDVEYVQAHGRWILRVYADKEGGITIDDCVNLSREIGDLLDVKDIINQEYVLEVSSPGLERPLRKEKDFIWALGKKIKVRMTTPVAGRRNFKGYLRDFREGKLYLQVEKDVIPIHRCDVEKANLVFEFEKKRNVIFGGV